jgi:hypothetical protein
MAPTPFASRTVTSRSRWRWRRGGGRAALATLRNTREPATYGSHQPRSSIPFQDVCSSDSTKDDNDGGEPHHDILRSLDDVVVVQVDSEIGGMVDVSSREAHDQKASWKFRTPEVDTTLKCLNTFVP